MEVRHEDAASQGNRPICGIYAFLNGLLYEKGEPIDKDKVEKIALKIWKIIIDNDYLDDKYSSEMNACSIGGKGSGIYSVVGEFFSSKNLIDFLNNNHNKIKAILEDNDVKNIDYIKADKYKNFPDGIDSNPNSFYLIPINSFKDSCWNIANKNNMHWICVRPQGSDLIIFNSDKHTRKGYATEKRALKKSGYDGKEISNIGELKAVYKCMYDRKDCPFCFGYWALRKGLFCSLHCNDKKKYLHNLCKLIEKCSTYEFIKNDLFAIEVELNVSSNNNISNVRGNKS